MKKNNEDDDFKMHPALIVTVPFAIALAAIWGGFYFFFKYAAGTWMEWPTIITAVIIIFFAFALLNIFIQEDLK